ncbi:biotin/lipoyl-binding protein, partial [Acinetobacter lactucae]
MFRKEALEAQRSKWVGNIVLLRPISFALMTMFAAVVGLVIILFLFFGSYTKRISVTGQLMPNLGLIQVYSPDRGIIAEKFVKEGQSIKKGDVLYTISTSRFNKSDSYNA